VDKPTLLIADDHPRILESVKLLLAADFTIVGAVADGEALIAAARELRPDVVVTDLVMEPTNGLEAAAILLAEFAPPPLIILLTVVEGAEVIQEALEAGIRGYVAKTRISEDLVPAVRSVLGGSRFISVTSNGAH
jgi:DNA-binding NarL/FixJ family response regulator